MNGANSRSMVSLCESWDINLFTWLSQVIVSLKMTLSIFMVGLDCTTPPGVVIVVMLGMFLLIVGGIVKIAVLVMLSFSLFDFMYFSNITMAASDLIVIPCRLASDIAIKESSTYVVAVGWLH